jgi:hypothetical protein
VPLCWPADATEWVAGVWRDIGFEDAKSALPKSQPHCDNQHTRASTLPLSGNTGHAANSLMAVL